MPQTGSRKRPAPGSSSFVQHSTQPLPNQSNRSARNAPESSPSWPQPATASDMMGYPDPSGVYDSNLYADMASQPMLQMPSNQLTRRNTNNPVVANGSYTNGGNDMWPTAVDGLAQQQGDIGWPQTTDDEKLDQEAQEAMEAAKKSRKSIPPFVQKLRRCVVYRPRRYQMLT